MTIGVPAHARDAITAKTAKAAAYRTAIGGAQLWLLAVTGTEFANGDGAYVLQDLPRPASFDRAFVLDRKSALRIVELQSDSPMERAELSTYPDVPQREGE